MTLQTALGYVPSNPNLIINGGFAVNQRVYTTGTALAAGVFAHDRWKAGAAGGAYSFTQLDSPTTITITAGTFIQVVETKNVQGGSYVLSWTGTATARYGLNSATPSGSYVASPILITGQTAATAISVEFGTGTLTNVKLEMGTVATPFVHKPYAEELKDCQRYGNAILPLGHATSVLTLGQAISATTARIIFNLPVPMRSIPSLVVGGTIGNFTLSAATETGLPVSTFAVEYSTNTIVQIRSVVASGLVAGDCTFLLNSTNTVSLFLSAEL